MLLESLVLCYASFTDINHQLIDMTIMLIVIIHHLWFKVERLPTNTEY